MTTFVLRVELHGATSDDYDRLHAAMEAAGFQRTMVFGGLPYHLPTGEYRYESDQETSLAVCGKAQTIAGNVRANPSIVVTESANGAAVGLKPVENLNIMVNALAGSGGRFVRPATTLLGKALAEGSGFGITPPPAGGLLGNALMQAAGLGLKK